MTKIDKTDVSRNYFGHELFHELERTAPRPPEGGGKDPLNPP